MCHGVWFEDFRIFFLSVLQMMCFRWLQATATFVAPREAAGMISGGFHGVSCVLGFGVEEAAELESEASLFTSQSTVQAKSPVLFLIHSISCM